jgi:UDP-glucuronate 4-epimerase
MKRILVSGCAGFIGSHTVEFLLKRGELVIGVDNLNDYYDPSIKKKNVELLEKYPNFHFEEGDMRNDKLLKDIFSESTITHIIHLASMAGVRNSLDNPNEYISNNIDAFITLLNTIVKNPNTCGNISHIVYASSSSVYGLNKIPFTETDSLNNTNSPYALSKKVMEEYAALYYRLYGIKSIGLRFFTVYGPRGRPDMAPDKFLRAIHNQTPITQYGNGNSSRDYTYIEDIVSGVVSSLDKESNIEHQIYNLGNNNGITLKEFISTCEKVVGKKAIINQIENQKGDVPITLANIEKAKKELNYNPNTTLLKGLQKTYQYIINN